jgi:hypothetical protein
MSFRTISIHAGLLSWLIFFNLDFQVIVENAIAPVVFSCGNEKLLGDFLQTKAPHFS